LVLGVEMPEDSPEEEEEDCTAQNEEDGEGDGINVGSWGSIHPHLHYFHCAKLEKATH